MDFALQSTANVAHFACTNLTSTDSQLPFSANIARFARKNPISVDFEVQLSLA